MIDIIINNINESVEIGDVVYAVAVTSTSNNAASDPFFEGNFNNITEVGTITAFFEANVPVTTGNPLGIIKGLSFDNSYSNVTPLNGDFLMFSKNKIANTSGLLGYYMDISFVNNSTTYAELFQVGSSAEISSK